MDAYRNESDGTVLSKGKLCVWLTLTFIAISLAFRSKEYGPVIFNQQDYISYVRSVNQASVQVSHGMHFPRLSDYDLEGRGYPLFQFYPPLSFLVPAYLDVYLFHNIRDSINLAIVACYITIGLSLFYVARSLALSRGASWISACALLTFPYVTHISVFNIPMFYGVTACALSLAGVVFFLQRPGVLRFYVAGLFGATLPLSHFLSTVMYLPCIVFLIPFMEWQLALRGRRSVSAFSILFAIAALSLGLLSAAFQIGPNVIYGLHHWLRINGSLSTAEQMAHFATLYTTLPTLLSPRLSEATYLQEPFLGEYGFQLGLGYTIGISLALARLVRWERSSRWAVGALVIVVAAVFFMSPAVVNSVGILGVFQFPTRFLGVVGLVGALLVGFGAEFLAGGDVHDGAESSGDKLGNGGPFYVAFGVGVVACSSMATQYLVNIDQSSLTGLMNPVKVADVLRDSKSGFSYDYLLDSYHFGSLFPEQKLYGGADYFLYYHDGLMERNVSYSFPATNIRRGTRIQVTGILPDEVALPQEIDLLINNRKIGTIRIANRTFQAECAIEEDIPSARYLSYLAERTFTRNGRKFVAKASTVRFIGLPRSETVLYWDAFKSYWRHSGNVYEFENPEVDNDLTYVFPVLAYPGLQAATVDGKPVQIVPIPRNDQVYCGVRFPHRGPAHLEIRFTGNGACNRISLAGVIGLLVCGAAMPRFNKLRRDRRN
jgi:hypothetical protein